ncbi:MAG: FtsL-like putative cell division protein [Bacteroidota bacterium]
MNKLKNAIRPKAIVKPARKHSFRSFEMLNSKMHVGRSVSGFLDGSFFSRENLAKQIPFILYLTFLGVLYIANSYNAEKTIIDISKTKRELEELRFSYITNKSELMFHSKQSEVALKLMNSGIKESIVPPLKLYVKAGK